VMLDAMLSPFLKKIRQLALVMVLPGDELD
jgi:hypothetical protein